MAVTLSNPTSNLRDRPRDAGRKLSMARYDDPAWLARMLVDVVRAAAAIDSSLPLKAGHDLFRIGLDNRHLPHALRKYILINYK